jgi:exonuclease III
MCGASTPSFGLCKTTKKDCDKYTGEDTIATYDTSKPENKEKQEYGFKFGYKFSDKFKNCANLILNSSYEWDSTASKTTFKLPSPFKIMSYNIWFSIKQFDASTPEHETRNLFERSFFQTRMLNIARIINNSGADVVCLQEYTQQSHELLFDLLKEQYPYFYETPFTPNVDNNGPRGRSVETVCYSKYPAKSFKLFAVEGSLSYNNSMIVVEFANVIIFNVYLQAGTKYSPGQSDTWFNYSRCRYHEYLSIQEYLKKNNPENKPVVVVGDFNTDLNGDLKEWPELKAFKEMDLEDSYLAVTNDRNSGFTENTDINTMRWNLKFERKIFRIDGIFHTRRRIKTLKTKLLGNHPIDIPESMQDEFVKFRVPNGEFSRSKLKFIDGEIKLFPSDHFAVVSSLQIVT